MTGRWRWDFWSCRRVRWEVWRESGGRGRDGRKETNERKLKSAPRVRLREDSARPQQLARFAPVTCNRPKCTITCGGGGRGARLR